MKLRSCYVSNSSSSSYIIEFQDLNISMRIAGQEITLENFIDYIRSRESLNSYTKICEITFEEKEIEELIKRIDNQIQYVDEDSKRELMILKDDILNRTKSNFIRFNLSYHDKIGHFILSLLKEYEVIKIRDVFEA